MKKQAVILDCDPGHDDAIALAILLGAENIELKAVTSSAGNQTQAKTSGKVRKLLTLFDFKEIPVAKGAEKPLVRELIIAESIHGKSGLDGAELPEPEVPLSEDKAIDLIANILKTSPEPVVLVATGPLTTMASFLVAYPELKGQIKEIVFMGGACFGGNWTSTAEFNIFVDPEAADIVLRSGVKLAMFGLDVTLKAQFFSEDVAEVRQLGNQSSQVLGGLLDFFNQRVAQPLLPKPGHIEGMHLHDACAAAYVVAPDLFTTLPLYVEVDTRPGLTLGSTLVDYTGKRQLAANADVGFDLDLPRFRELVIQSIGRMA